jgi:hypothetical protein
VQREFDAQSGKRQRRAGGFGQDAAAFLNKTSSDSPRLAPAAWIFVKQGRLFILRHRSRQDLAEPAPSPSCGHKFSGDINGLKAL